MITNSTLKIIFIALFVFQLSPLLFATDYNMSIQPHVGSHYLTSSILRDYYDRNIVFSYGATVVLMNEEIKTGVFLKYLRYSFKVSDELLLSGEKDIDGSWLMIGIQKDIPISKYILFGRIGLTIHNDDLAFADSDDKRVGTYYSLGVKYRISNYFKFFCETAYVYESLSVPMYVHIRYSRHQAYLAGKSFQTGGLLIQTGISFSLFSDI